MESKPLPWQPLLQQINAERSTSIEAIAYLEKFNLESITKITEIKTSLLLKKNGPEIERFINKRISSYQKNIELCHRHLLTLSQHEEESMRIEADLLQVPEGTHSISLYERLLVFGKKVTELKFQRAEQLHASSQRLLENNRKQWNKMLVILSERNFTHKEGLSFVDLAIRNETIFPVMSQVANMNTVRAAKLMKALRHFEREVKVIKKEM